jgi:hypothetical protein
MTDLGKCVNPARPNGILHQNITVKKVFLKSAWTGVRNPYKSNYNNELYVLQVLGTDPGQARDKVTG